MHSWRGSDPVPDEQCFEAIKAGIDAVPPGAKMFLNSGEFYANDLGTGNLELLARFFDKYPSYADRTFLSVKVNMTTPLVRFVSNDGAETVGRCQWAQAGFFAGESASQCR